MSLQFDIGEKSRRVGRFLGKVHRELQRALEHEKKTRRVTQQQIATLLGINRSVINREFMGGGNLTLRRLAELAWALGWEIVFELRRPQTTHGQNHFLHAPIETGTTGNSHLSTSKVGGPSTETTPQRRAA